MPEALDMVRLLVAGHEAVTRTARAAFPAAEKSRRRIHLRPAHAAAADS